MSKHKKSPVAKSATTETFNIIGDEVTLTLSDHYRFDLSDNFSKEYFLMDLDRETLKGLAEFILNYLENN